MRIALLLLALTSAVAHAAHAEDVAKRFDPCVEAGIKNSIVFLGELTKDSTPAFHATGFLVSVDGIFYVVTAKHVVWDVRTKSLRDANMLAFFNDRSGKVVARPLTLAQTRFGAAWVFHPNENVDVAMLPFPLDEQRDDVRVIPSDMFEPSSRLSELQDLFFLSYHPGLEMPGKVAPIARRGMISIFKEDGTFFMDAFIFPGNSGSPVFAKPSAMTFLKGGSVTPGDPQGCKFVGLAGEYLPYVDIAVSAQTKRPRVTFEENAGLARVWPVEFLTGIIASEPFKTQQNKLRKSAPR